MQDLAKTLVWILLLATVASAGLSGVKLTEALWQAWQLDSSQSGAAGLPRTASSRIAFNR
jgi:hypothetical protein